MRIVGTLAENCKSCAKAAGCDRFLRHALRGSLCPLRRRGISCSPAAAGRLTGRRWRGFSLLDFHGVSGRPLLLALVISAIHAQVLEPATGIEGAGLLKN